MPIRYERTEGGWHIGHCLTCDSVSLLCSTRERAQGWGSEHTCPPVCMICGERNYGSTEPVCEICVEEAPLIAHSY